MATASFQRLEARKRGLLNPHPAHASAHLDHHPIPRVQGSSLHCTPGTWSNSRSNPRAASIRRRYVDHMHMLGIPTQREHRSNEPAKCLPEFKFFHSLARSTLSLSRGQAKPRQTRQNQGRTLVRRREKRGVGGIRHASLGRYASSDEMMRFRFLGAQIFSRRHFPRGLPQ
ncbi:hypothetical protein FA13DRAFT_527739 [Coprinellus micaceus]|uniref:Uncharacterized protein n=1 Tax=Coprinellus micaceus TaxID=71717 RepID=A0A4Y7T9T6_COPMI|nr:hypothetical protein FA13DRAFT_527739 [Coprinellus micaceus]